MFLSVLSRVRRVIKFLVDVFCTQELFRDVIYSQYFSTASTARSSEIHNRHFAQIYKAQFTKKGSADAKYS